MAFAPQQLDRGALDAGRHAPLGLVENAVGVEPKRADIDGITNLCRCGTYPRVRKAIARAAKAMGGKA